MVKADVSSSGNAGLAVPIFVAVDRDGGAQVREEVLWKLGDARYVPETAAQRLCGEVGVLGSGAEKIAAQQIQDALRLYPATVYDPAAGCVRIQVEVRLQDQMFRDEVDWDLADPQNTPYKYASAVCYELGLGWDAAAAVAAAVEAQLQLKSEARRAGGTKPDDSVEYSKVGTQGPRVEPFEAAR